MKIQMLSTRKGSVDGINLSVYEAGSVHDLSASKGGRELATVFVREGWAVDESKAIESAPENKMLKRAYSRKR
jgi:hypothetical protein